MFLNVYFAGTTFLLISFAFLHIVHLWDVVYERGLENELTSHYFLWKARLKFVFLNFVSSKAPSDHFYIRRMCFSRRLNRLHYSHRLHSMIYHWGRAARTPPPLSRFNASLGRWDSLTQEVVGPWLRPLQRAGVGVDGAAATHRPCPSTPNHQVNSWSPEPKWLGFLPVSRGSVWDYPRVIKQGTQVNTDK